MSDLFDDFRRRWTLEFASLGLLAASCLLTCVPNRFGGSASFLSSAYTWLGPSQEVAASWEVAASREVAARGLGPSTVEKPSASHPASGPAPYVLQRC